MSNKMRWSLDEIYTSFESKKYNDDLKQLGIIIKDAINWTKNELTTNDDLINKLEQIIKNDTTIKTYIYRLSAYAALTLATDATNEDALNALDKVEKWDVEASNLGTICARYIGQIDDLDSVIEQSELLAEHKYYLNELAKNAKYLLAQDVEETISTLSLTGSNAFARMRNMIDGTMMVEIEEDGQLKELPLPVIRNMAFSSDKDVRKRAYKAELAAYKKIELPLNHALNAIKGESMAICKMRGYNSILDKTLVDSRIDDATLDAMLSAMVDAMPHFRRYLKAKAKVLGYENALPFYDLFAPLGGDNSPTYTYDSAREFLEETFASFSKETSEFVSNAFENRWIDAESREGKGGGAFCENLHFIGESRILSNFDGSFSQVSTLAHELGHAWHGHCLKNESILNTDYTMPLAETASIFNECVVADRAIKNASSEEKLSLLESDLMSSTQVIVDIYSRYLFESKVIKVREDHSMSIQEMKEAMIDAQKQAYGDGLDEKYLHPYMWACKIHYYFPTLAFYNWPYAFGLLFGKGVFARYQQVGESFVDEYKELLKASGSGDVADVAKRMNIDIRVKAFWEQSLSIIIKEIDLFCEIVDNEY